MTLDRYVGVPWLERGRTLAGCDCWGLLRIVYAEQLGIELPSYGDDYATGADSRALHDLITGELGPWREVPAGGERVLDGVLTMDGGAIRHVGIVIGCGRMLHMPRESGSVVESYRTHVYRRRVAGFFRHRSVAA